MLLRVSLLAMFLFSTVHLTLAEEPKAEWYGPPKISVMVGFIRNASQKIDMDYFRKNVGSEFDADKLVSDIKKAGATYIIFYDKWHDGLVFHDTTTTKNKTDRDFVGEVAKACQKHDVAMMVYFNSIIDGNTEFTQWALKDSEGKFLLFSGKWDDIYVHTMTSPFRDVVDQQLEEIFSKYGKIGGIWLDIFSERIMPHDPWMQKVYTQMYGKSLEDASKEQREVFRLKIMEEYLASTKKLCDKYQKNPVWASNGSARDCLRDGNYARQIGSQLDYTSFEGHYISTNERYARLAWIQDKPLELGILISNSWFVPMKSEANLARTTANEVLCMSAMSLCQGANIWLAVTPSFSGAFGQDLAQVEYVGHWFKKTEPYLSGARPYAEVGVALNLPEYGANALVQANQLWSDYPFLETYSEFRVYSLSDDIFGAGVPNTLLYEDMADKTPDALDLKGLKAVVLPETAAISENYAQQLRDFVENGGTLLAFGSSSRVNGRGEVQDYFSMGDLFGVRYQGQADFKELTRTGSATASSSERKTWGIENALDEETTFWVAKQEDENWAEFKFPQTIDVSRIELVARMGVFHVEDVDIEIRKDGIWKNVYHLRGNKKKTIFIELAAPVSTDNLRINILKQRWNNEERKGADLETIRIVDANGENWAPKTVSKVAVNVSDETLKALLGTDTLSVFPVAARVEITDGNVLASYPTPAGDYPAIVHKSYGKGNVYYCAASESSVVGNPVFWRAIRGLLVEEPAIEWKDPKDLRQYKFVFTRVGSKYVIHVIDRNPNDNPVAFKAVELLVNPKNIGQITRVQNVGLDYTFSPTMEKGKIKLTMTPDPVASVCLW